MTARGDAVHAVPEKVQEFLERDDVEGLQEEAEQSLSQSPLGVPGVVSETERTVQSKVSVGGLISSEKENPLERDVVKEVVCGKQAVPAAVPASFFEHEGSSTTLINVVIPGSLNVREGGGSHNVVYKYVGPLPPEYMKRVRNDDIDECPPCRQQAAVCPPGTIALDAAKRLTFRKKKG
jgi:hypothetical protein